MTRRTLLLGLLALPMLVLPVLAGPARADSLLDQVRARGTLRIATTGANKPYTSVGPDGVLVGFDIDWAKEIAAGLGVKPEFVKLDWRGILPGLIARQFDAVLSAVRVTPERAAAFDFSTAYGTDAVTIAVPAANTTIHGIEDLRGLVVAAATGSVQDQFARERSGAREVRGLRGLPDIMLDISLGREDAAIVGRGGAAAFIKETGANLRLVGEYEAGDLAAVFPKNSPELVAAVNAIIGARRADGTAGRIQERWFGTTP